MKISTEQVLHVANLARLRIDPAEVAKIAGQVATILNYVDQLGQVDTEGVPPTTHAVARTNGFREDVVHDHLGAEKSLANAPAQQASCFTVPKVI